MAYLKKLAWLIPVALVAAPAAIGIGKISAGGAVSLALPYFGAALTLALGILLIVGIRRGTVRRLITNAIDWALSLFAFRVSDFVHNLVPLLAVGLVVAGLYSAFKLHYSTGTLLHVYLLIGAIAGGAILAGAYLLASRWAKPVFVACGVVLVGLGIWIHRYESEQVTLYNQALVELDKGNLPKAIELFDQSVAAYKAESQRSQLGQLIYPAPRKDLEARAHFHKGNCLVRMQKPQEAVEAYKVSLRSNPGNCYQEVTVEKAAQLFNDALHTQANLEKLFSTGQAGGRPMGRGRGQGQPQPGPQRDRQPNPGAGKQPRDSL